MKFKFTVSVDFDLTWEVETQREKLKPELRFLTMEQIAQRASLGILGAGDDFEEDLKKRLGFSDAEHFSVRNVRVESLEDDKNE